MILPWGKYKGQDLEDVPSSYLKWVAENCENDEIATEADKEYSWRTDNNAHKED